MTLDISAIPATQKMHSLKVISPFVVETKEHYYKDAKLVHTFKLLQESKTIDHEILISSAKEFTQLKNIDSVRPGQWLLVEYEEDFFLGIVLEVSCTGARVQCLEPYDISEPQDLEKRHISAWCTLDKRFEPPVLPDVVQVKPGLKYVYFKLYQLKNLPTVPAEFQWNSSGVIKNYWKMTGTNGTSGIPLKFRWNSSSS